MKISRTKGKQGELEACRYLSAYTKLEWERTAQRWGKAIADVWVPEKPDLGVHVEVKRHKKGLIRPTQMAKMHCVLETADGLHLTLLANLTMALQFRTIPVRTITFNTVSEFHRQATEDCRPGDLPIVLMRHDHGQWVVVWNKVHGRALSALLGSYLHGCCDAA